MSTASTSRKYSMILSTARDLFWKHGFRRVSIEEICDKAPVSKMTFYKYFPNKIELAKEVFRSESQNGVTRFKNILQHENSPAEMLSRIVQLKLDGAAHISNEFLHDFYQDNSEGLKEFVAQTSRNCWLQIVEDVREAQNKNIFTREIRPELLLYLAEAMGSLVTNKELLASYSGPHQLISELTHLMVYGIGAGVSSGINGD